MRCRTTTPLVQTPCDRRLGTTEKGQLILYPLTVPLQFKLLSAQAKSSADLVAALAKSMMDAQAKSNEAMLDRLFTKFAGIISNSSASDAPTDTSMPLSTPRYLPTVNIPKWSSGCSPSEYFSMYEQALTYNRVRKSEWGKFLLPLHLSGKAQSCFQSQVPVDIIDKYDIVKEILLESLGDTPSQAGREWWTFTRRHGETYQDMGQHLQLLNARRLAHVHDKADIMEVIICLAFYIFYHMIVLPLS